MVADGWLPADMPDTALLPGDSGLTFDGDGYHMDGRFLRESVEDRRLIAPASFPATGNMPEPNYSAGSDTTSLLTAVKLSAGCTRSDRRRMERASRRKGRCL